MSDRETSPAPAINEDQGEFSDDDADSLLALLPLLPDEFSTFSGMLARSLGRA
jgi:hypothetical protein